ncbi:MAG: hypothetical protein JXK16_02460 [Thiotrichales bacterium]|nr:hypothetical protein [Thiotrichales bacterium]
MRTKFDVDVLSFKKIKVLEGAWTTDDYQKMLEIMEMEDGVEQMNPSEIKEMCLMSLSDNEPHDAANVVLTHLFSNTLSAGKIEQLSHQMPDDRMWEQYSDIMAHEKLFNAYALLREAFNGTFTQPNGVKFTVKLHAQHAESFNVFDDFAEAPLVRVLACGLPESAILNRLYEDPLVGDEFPEAEGVLWQLNKLEQTKNDATYEIISSAFWFGALEDVTEFKAETHADKIADED